MYRESETENTEIIAREWSHKKEHRRRRRTGMRYLEVRYIWWQQYWNQRDLLVYLYDCCFVLFCFKGGIRCMIGCCFSQHFTECMYSSNLEVSQIPLVLAFPQDVPDGAPSLIRFEMFILVRNCTVFTDPPIFSPVIIDPKHICLPAWLTPFWVVKPCPTY